MGLQSVCLPVQANPLVLDLLFHNFCIEVTHGNDSHARRMVKPAADRLAEQKLKCLYLWTLAFRAMPLKLRRLLNLVCTPYDSHQVAFDRSF